MHQISYITSPFQDVSEILKDVMKKSKMQMRNTTCNLEVAVSNLEHGRCN